MSMMRWSPVFPDLRDMSRVMDRLAEEGMRPGRFIPDFGETFALSVDMYETPKEMVVKFSVPGMRPEDIDVHIADNVLSVKGERKVEEEVKREDYFYQEQRYGSFSRTISLPGTVNADKSEASLVNGVLTISIPKTGGAKAKAIKVKSTGIAEGKAKKIAASKPKPAKK
jgi:HSP20 family protein